MATKLYVGKLPYRFSDEDLKKLFEEHGTVESAVIINDRELNRSKGFGFVEMSNEEEANAAIAALNDKELDGRNLVVNEARPSRFEK